MKNFGILEEQGVFVTVVREDGLELDYAIDDVRPIAKKTEETVRSGCTFDRQVVGANEELRHPGGYSGPETISHRATSREQEDTREHTGRTEGLGSAGVDDEKTVTPPQCCTAKTTFLPLPPPWRRFF